MHACVCTCMHEYACVCMCVHVLNSKTLKNNVNETIMRTAMACSANTALDLFTYSIILITTYNSKMMRTKKFK